MSSSKPAKTLKALALAMGHGGAAVVGPCLPTCGSGFLTSVRLPVYQLLGATHPPATPRRQPDPRVMSCWPTALSCRILQSCEHCVHD